MSDQVGPRLARLRLRSISCGCGKYPCRHEVEEALAYGGEAAYRGHPGLVGAFRKGWNAYVAGEKVWANPYNKRERRDRRGRLNAGFAPAYQHAWEAGWAWAEHYGAVDDVDTTRVLAALTGNRLDCFDASRPPEGWRAVPQPPSPTS